MLVTVISTSVLCRCRKGTSDNIGRFEFVTSSYIIRNYISPIKDSDSTIVSGTMIFITI